MGSMFTLVNNQTGFPPTSLATLSLPPSQAPSPPCPRPSSKSPFPPPCSPSLISAVLLASKCITPKSMLLTVIFLPGSRSYFIASWWLSENATLRSPTPPLGRWATLIDGLEISGAPNVTGPTALKATCPNSTHHLQAPAYSPKLPIHCWPL